MQPDNKARLAHHRQFAQWDPVRYLKGSCALCEREFTISILNGRAETCIKSSACPKCLDVLNAPGQVRFQRSLQLFSVTGKCVYCGSEVPSAVPKTGERQTYYS